MTSTIISLREHYPNVTIDILAERRNAGVFELIPDIHGVYLYDKVGDMLRVFRFRYDLIIDTEQWHRLSAVVARLIRASVRIGFATNERSRLFSYPVPYSHDDYEEDSFLNLLGPLGITPSVVGRKFPLHVASEDRKHVDNLLGVFSSHHYVVLFPGATIAERRWGEFAHLAQRLAVENIRVVVIGGPDDLAAGERIIAGTLGLNLAGKTSLAETAALIERSVLLVSGDSGILHIGVGLGKPTVSLFGPGIEKKWAPRSPKHIVINKHLSCSPCTQFGYTPKCPINAKCMGDISVDEVYAAVMELWAREVGQKQGIGR